MANNWNSVLDYIYTCGQSRFWRALFLTFSNGNSTSRLKMFLKNHSEHKSMQVKFFFKCGERRKTCWICRTGETRWKCTVWRRERAAEREATGDVGRPEATERSLTRSSSLYTVQTTRHNHEGRSGKKEVQEEEEETTVIFVFSIPFFSKSSSAAKVADRTSTENWSGYISFWWGGGGGGGGGNENCYS